VLRRVTGVWKIAKRTVLLDANVLLDKKPQHLPVAWLSIPRPLTLPSPPRRGQDSRRVLSSRGRGRVRGTPFSSL